MPSPLSSSSSVASLHPSPSKSVDEFEVQPDSPSAHLSRSLDIPSPSRSISWTIRGRGSIILLGFNTKFAESQPFE